jgi:hypothetical protein
VHPLPHREEPPQTRSRKGGPAAAAELASFKHFKAVSEADARAQLLLYLCEEGLFRSEWLDVWTDK